MPLSQTRHYNRRLPRYTSYPTAPHFTPEIDADIHRGWLGALDPADPLSIYLHIPFCRQLCWFCGCNTRAVNRPAILARFGERLEAEMDLICEALPDRLAASHIHFGGGSPNALAPDGFSALIDRLKRRFRFGPETEVAVELDPRSVAEPFITACADAGVSRVSLGVQDLDPVVQKAINRIQPHDLIAQVVDSLRKAGIGDINMDLMYGLPHQTLDGVLSTVDRVAALQPTRIALFGYAHVPWMKAHQNLMDESALPDAEARRQQADAAADRLAALGYQPVGLDHFALPDTPMAAHGRDGALRRNFQGYTTDLADTLIGIGPSAIGMLPQGYVQNTADVRIWRQEIDARRLPVARGIAIDDDDRLRRAVIERLMCDLSVDLAQIAGDFGLTAGEFAEELAALQALERDGILEIDRFRITVAGKQRALVRVAAAVFDRYLQESSTPGAAPQHAAAV